jgi:hypothetical protein
MKLFAIYIGGEFKGANIELHDMRFVVAPSIADTHEELKRQWWGIPKSLHIDCWAEISEVDGYRVDLRPEPFIGPEKLFYINLGGYDAQEFREQHRNLFLVAGGVPEAKKRAIKHAKQWKVPHRDEMYEAEQAFALNDCARAQQLYLHLTPVAETKPLHFNCGYTPIKRQAK